MIYSLLVLAFIASSIALDYELNRPRDRDQADDDDRYCPTCGAEYID